MQPVVIAADDFSALHAPGWYQVELDGFVLDFYFRPSEHARAYVVSPGWMNRVTHPYPFFQRISWFDRLDGIGISLADPLLRLDEHVQLGWFVGTDRADFSRVTAAYLERLLEHFGVPRARTLFFGSSAGGFASLAFAALVRGSKVLAFNPQTDILRFHDVTELAKMTRAAFGRRDMIKIRDAYSTRTSIAALWRSEGYVPPGQIIVNTHDRWHVEQHIAPLLGSLAGGVIGGELGVRFLSDADAGHNPPGPGVLVPIMRTLVEEPMIGQPRKAGRDG